jgi:hypothetical protein
MKHFLDEGGIVSSISDFSVSIQTSSESVPSTPSWLGEVTLIAHSLKRLGVLTAIEDRVRFARRRFGRYEVIDFVAVLLGYAISGEPTLQAFYERVEPFAPAFMALFGRNRLPARSTLSRFLAALEEAPIEALRELFLEDLCSRPLSEEKPGGVWDRQESYWLVFDVDGTRHAARQRAVPQTADRPPAQRRLREVCAPGYLGRKRGEIVRTRTTVLQAHTHQWLGTFSGAGNGDYRGELLQAVKAISAYMKAQSVPLSQAVVRLDGQYGNGAIVLDLRGLAYVMRSKDSHLLDLPAVQTRLQAPPDHQTTHPETGTQRALFDFPTLQVSATGERSRVIVATHPAAAASAAVGETREGMVYELFFTALPVGAFTAADVVDLYLGRGAFETVLADEDQEQDADRWCSHTPCGQEFWQILCQWVWNLRLRLGQALHATAMRMTEFAPAAVSAQPASVVPSASSPSYGPPVFAKSWKRGRMSGQDFVLQPDGTLRCLAGHPLYPQERRPERDGTVRVVYAARIGDCRPCPLRECCQWHGTQTSKARRVSAVLHPQGSAPIAPLNEPAPTRLAAHPILWGDWPRRSQRREFMKLLRHQRVDVRMAATSPPAQPPPARPLSRAQRAHWRLSWAERLARNALPSASPSVSITLFGVPDAFAQSIGLQTL